MNVVAPGAIKTPIWKRGPRASATAEDSAKLEKFFSSAVPQGRWGEPEEVAKAVLFLASDDSSYVNAVELMVDGGATGAPFGAPMIQEAFTPPKLAKAHAKEIRTEVDVGQPGSNRLSPGKRFYRTTENWTVGRRRN